jgi:TonB family protein
MSNPETWKSWEGRLVDGKFPLRQWLGGSDHSAVFLTEVSGNGTQKAAIKLIEAPSAEGADPQVEHLRATSRLSHPNLIRTFDAGHCRMDDTSVAYVVTECADDDLSQILPQRALEAKEVTDLLPPILGALSYLHGSGMVHGRVKPSNVLAVGDQLKLSSDQVTVTADQNGTRRRRDAYDAPETAAGIVSPAGDIWSFGVTMVAALTQDVAFASTDSLKDPGLPKNVPEPFRSIVQGCLHLDPQRRSTLQEIQGKLQGGTRATAVADRAATVKETLPPAPPVHSVPAPTPSRRPAFTVTAMLAGVLALLFLIFHFRGSKPDVPAQETPQQPAPTTPQTAPAEQPKPVPQGADTNGEVARQILPEIPQSAKNTITGTIKVAVKVAVDATGKVTAGSLKSAGPSHYFATHALQAAQQWDFTPPQVNGQAVPSTWLIQFRFRRGSTQASAQRVTR